MRVIVNGAQQSLATASTVQQLLSHLEHIKGRVAIEVNGEIVPRSTFTQHILQEGDTVEIVQAIGGG